MTARDRRWAAVYDHHDRLLRLARGRLKNAHDAEDCVQEAMLRCVEFADLDEERLAQFLTTVTVRLCTDVHRGRQRRDRLASRLTAYWSHEPGHEDGVCDRAESVWLTQGLAGLPARQRAIVEARAEGLSCGAVAERLLVPYTTVESALARVRASLRRTLESTLGIAAAWPWRRLRRVLAGGTTATAAILTVAVVGHPAARPATVAAPAAHGSGASVAAASPRRLRGVPVASAVRRVPGARAAAVRPGSGGTGPGLVPPAGTIQQSWVLHTGGLEVGGTTDDEYSFDEVVAQCVRYGYAIGERADCRYPPGHPRREQHETAGTPDPSEIVR
jgi:RNA polymerase sigma factor (sigma-70 family)